MYQMLSFICEYVLIALYNMIRSNCSEASSQYI